MRVRFSPPAPTIMNTPQPGIYHHYKGNEYMVIGVATHSETEEELVVYRTLYGDYRLIVRPKKMFLENVKVGDYSGPRFKLIKKF